MFSRWPPSWRVEWNGFNNFESLCYPDTSHQVSVELDITMVQEMSYEKFQGGCHATHLGYWSIKILAILNPQIAQMPPTKFWFNVT